MNESLNSPLGYFVSTDLKWDQLGSRVNFISRSMILEMCVRLSLRVQGHIAEFGVAGGASTRIIDRSLRRFQRRPLIPFRGKKIFAFDSFEGLPEEYEGAPKGHFAGEVPKIRGVNFVKGYFEDTCTIQLQKKIGLLSFAHLDADLYSSTKFVLDWLTPMLTSGSLLLFDEFTGGDFSESRAFSDWMKENADIRIQRIAEFDRDPSGYGANLDRRLLYQVIRDPLPAAHKDRNSLEWKISYYLSRFGLLDMKSRFDNRY